MGVREEKKPPKTRNAMILGTSLAVVAAGCAMLLIEDFWRAPEIYPFVRDVFRQDFFDYPKTGYALAAVGGLLALLVIFAPASLKPFYAGTMFLLEKFGALIMKLVCAAIFFAVVAPIGIVMRAFGKDFFHADTISPDSYWIARPPKKFDRENYKRMF